MHGSDFLYKGKQSMVIVVCMDFDEIKEWHDSPRPKNGYVVKTWCQFE